MRTNATLFIASEFGGKQYHLHFQATCYVFTLERPFLFGKRIVTNFFNHTRQKNGYHKHLSYSFLFHITIIFFFQSLPGILYHSAP